jgi:hypothetical protein
MIFHHYAAPTELERSAKLGFYKYFVPPELGTSQIAT